MTWAAGTLEVDSFSSPINDEVFSLSGSALDGLELDEKSTDGDKGWSQLSQSSAPKGFMTIAWCRELNKEVI